MCLQFFTGYYYPPSILQINLDSIYIYIYIYVYIYIYISDIIPNSFNVKQATKPRVNQDIVYS